MRQPLSRFLFIGLLIAGLEEFITQGLLKGNVVGWIFPTLIAFVPFLVLTRVIAGALDRRLGGEAQGALAHYLVAGGLGLSFEWFVQGLSPWRDPNLLQIPFQLGMFSFWGAVGFGPRLCLDRRESVSRLRKGFVRSLVLGFAIIYFLAFAIPPAIRFGPVIAAVVVTFALLNVLYARYIRTLGQGGPA